MTRRIACTSVVITILAIGGCGERPAGEQPAADVRVPLVSAAVTTSTAASVTSEPLVNPESLPALPSGGTVYVNLVLLDRTVQIAPGIKYRAWTFNGTVPGPVIHAQVGDTIDVTLTNKAMMGHSIDFHAALAPPNIAYQTVAPGKTLHFSWVAEYPGAFLYHCGTPPVLAH